MLESAELFIRRVHPPNDGCGLPTGPLPSSPFELTAVEPATGQVLGSFRGHIARRSAWKSRRSDPLLTARETLDESLLFTVHRRGVLLPYGEVRDAEGKRVGTVRGYSLWDRTGKRLASRALGSAADRRILSPTGEL